MAKTYTAAGSATAGQVYTASAHNVIVTDVNNLIVPPSVQVIRSTDQTSFASGGTVSWSSAVFDTDGMWAAGAPTLITINTTGVYLVSFSGTITVASGLTLASPLIRRSGSTSFLSYAAVTSTQCIFAIAATMSLTAGTDTLTAGINLTGAATGTVLGNASEGTGQTRLTVSWIGRTS